MDEIELTVRNPSGLHARPGATFAKTAAGFRSKITVVNLTTGSAAVDGKSILRLLTIGVAGGHRIRISADGEDAGDALATLRDAVESGLGEAVEPA